MNRASHRIFTLLAPAAVALVVAAAVSCRRVEPTEPGHPAPLPVTRVELERDLAELSGRLYSARDLIIVPTRDWQRDDATGSWSMDGSAQVACRVLSPIQDGVTFRLSPGNPAAAGGLEIDWDGFPLAARISAVGTLEAAVPPSRLGPGTHMLTVRTRPGGTAPVLFTGLAFAFRGRTHDLPVEGRLRFQYLADLLTLGVTGSRGTEKNGGFVLEGPQALSLHLRQPATGVLRARVQNSSRRPAIFRAAHATGSVEARVDPHDRADIRLELPPGSERLELSTDGPAGGLFLWGAPHIHRTDPPRPPVVLITLDTTRRDAIGAFGGPEGVTPTLDALARRSTLYTSASAPSPWTLASHASLFTGRYPSRHGAGVRSTRLGTALPTLASTLRAHGYVTGGLAGGVLCSFRFGLARGFDLYHDPEGFERTGDAQTELALAFVEAHAGEPFLLFINYFDPHFPYAAPAEVQREQGVPSLLETIRGQTPWPQIVRGNAGAFARAVEGEHAASAEALAALRAAYLAEVAWVDRQVGRVLADLEARGLLDSSLIVVASDHGELLGERGFFSHSCRLDPELIDIPLLVKWPGQTAPRRVDSPVSLVDLLPTVLAAAGVPFPDTDGLPLPAEGTVLERDRVLAEEHEAFPIHPLFEHMRIAAHLFGERTARSRHTVWDQGGECLAWERGRWVAASCLEPHELLLARLHRELGWEDEAEPGPGAGLTEAERRSLEALGYLH